MAGYFQVERDLWTDPLFKNEPFTEREAWLWMRGRAAWRDYSYNYHWKIIHLKRGQIIVASRDLAKEWGWSEATVRRFLNRLENDQKVVTRTDAGVKVATICNYDLFCGDQAKVDARLTQTRRAPDAHKKERKKKDNDEVKAIQRGLTANGTEREGEATGQEKIQISSESLQERISFLIASYRPDEFDLQRYRGLVERDKVILEAWVDQLRLTEQEILSVVDRVMKRASTTTSISSLNYFTRAMKNFNDARQTPNQVCGAKKQAGTNPAAPMAEAKDKADQPAISMQDDASRLATAAEAMKIITQVGLSTRVNFKAGKMLSIDKTAEEEPMTTIPRKLSRIEALPLDDPERKALGIARSKNSLIQEARADQQRYADE